MRTEPRFVKPNDFENRTGKSLTAYFGDQENAERLANLFLLDVEDTLLARIDKISFRTTLWCNLTPLQLENLQLAIIKQAEYILRNGDFFTDSGYDMGKGQIISFEEIQRISVCGASIDLLTNCGLLNRVIQNRNRYFTFLQDDMWNINTQGGCNTIKNNDTVYELTINTNNNENKSVKWTLSKNTLVEINDEEHYIKAGGNTISAGNKNDYNFLTWGKETFNIKSDVVINAKWQKDSYTLTIQTNNDNNYALSWALKPNENVEITKTSISANGRSYQIDATTKVGYTWVGWNRTSFNINDDTFIEGQWSESKHIIKFSKYGPIDQRYYITLKRYVTVDGGLVTMSQVSLDSYSSELNESLITFENPGEGHWTINQGQTVTRTGTVSYNGMQVGTWSFDARYDENQSLYKYSQVWFTLDENLKYGNASLVSIQENGSIKINDEYLIANKPNEVGDDYTFIGWLINGNQRVELGNTYSFKLLDDISISAMWRKEENSYTLTINANNDTGDQRIWYLPYNKEINITTDTITADTYVYTIDKTSKIGYKWNGWDRETFNITDDISVNGNWVIGKNQITFKRSPVDEYVTLEYDNAVLVEIEDTGFIKINGSYVSEKPNVEGYEFIGWQVDSRRVVLGESYSFKLLKDINISGVWEKQCTLTINVNNDSKYKEEWVLNYQDRVEITNDTITAGLKKYTVNKTSKDGYKWTGWDKVSFDIIENTTINGTWKSNTHQITFKRTPLEDYVYENYPDGSLVVIESTGLIKIGERYVSEVPVAEGYKFLGWQIGGSKQVDLGDTYSFTLLNDVNISGRWEQVYDLQGTATVTVKIELRQRRANNWYLLIDASPKVTGNLVITDVISTGETHLTSMENHMSGEVIVEGNDNDQVYVPIDLQFKYRYQDKSYQWHYITIKDVSQQLSAFLDVNGQVLLNDTYSIDIKENK